MESHASDALNLLPGSVATAFGFGLSLTFTVVHGVRDEESGVTSALQNTSRHIGVGVLSAMAVMTTAATLPNAFERQRRMTRAP
ncbi:hypothetical protein [Deinococcus yavapaiensis]|uniref:Uncharacterized protein n=1 Tax=Deinococcus yavapaiensis KR-236 TaxID=694435 RepID=A0A318SDZ2_9DEIO|nr:hypothetical protein [Deinococcus yavapaiensis]PYE50978.1 hypothetical protein DES52_11645 [Deinococcus yavapaiensis KR-236]